MSGNNFSQIQKQYRFEEDKNTYLIEVSLDDYDDVYDEWDPAPFKKRFIEEEFDDFIITSSEDIPFTYNTVIVLYIPEAKKDIYRESSVILAYKNYYSYAVEKVQRSLLKLNKKTISYLLLAVLFLSLGYYFQTSIESIVIDVLKEGILIGGWVFLWEVFTNVFIKKREIQNRYKLYRRIYLSDIRFIYS